MYDNFLKFGLRSIGIAFKTPCSDPKGVIADNAKRSLELITFVAADFLVRRATQQSVRKPRNGGRWTCPRDRETRL